MKAMGVGWNNFRDLMTRSIRAPPQHLRVVARSPRRVVHCVRLIAELGSSAELKAARSSDWCCAVSTKADFRPPYQVHAAHCYARSSAELTIAEAANSSMRANPWDANCSDLDLSPDHRNFCSRLGGVEPTVTPLSRFAVLARY